MNECNRQITPAGSQGDSHHRHRLKHCTTTTQRIEELSGQAVTPAPYERAPLARPSPTTQTAPCLERSEADLPMQRIITSASPFGARPTCDLLLLWTSGRVRDRDL
jgi:hypothetical protein